MKFLFHLTIAGMMAATLAGAQAQDRSGGVRVLGEIACDCAITGMLTAELSAGESGLPQRAMINSDGTFQFDAASPGTHELLITGTGGAVIYRQFVSLTGPSQQLSIRLPNQRRDSANRAAGDTVSLQQLEHKVPGPARKAFEKGRNAARKQNWAEAEKQFQDAVTKDPEFADAYNELGVSEVSQGKLADAARQFQKAIDLAPEHRLALPNLSIVLAKMNNYKDAGEVARRALRIAPDMAQLRLILGISLIVAHGNTDEAMDNLKKAEGQFPKAHLLEAQLFSQAGQAADAAEQLQKYLKTAGPNDPQRSKVEADLARLQHDSQTKE